MTKKMILIVSIFYILVALTPNLFAVPSGKTVSWEGSGQGQIVFEGNEHAEKGFKCDSCHPSLFQMKKGSAKITLASHTNGQFCNACHNGKTAFGTDDPKKCNECHKKGEQHHKNKDKDKHHD
ncbi:MAG TPA: c(7)-type cytochrome triheme domain-containing protein [Thermodesulfovibrionales bacterium]|nr:c(7)-type cytochrome triheme domain-containing protein [Thermodesulfovibrionales bacterium]